MYLVGFQPKKRQTQGSNVAFPSVCFEYVLLPLVNKETALAYGKAEDSKSENLSRDRGGKKAEPERCHVATQKPRSNKPLQMKANIYKQSFW